MARGPAVGPLVVSCPSCRALAGRQCVDARGYLYRGGVHTARHGAWMEVEAAEHEQAQQRDRERV